MSYRINRNTEIVIGHEGEKGFREVRFDVSELPEGIIYLEHLRYGDKYAYPIRLERVGDEAIWIPNETDTAKRGTGRGQLVVYVGDEVVAKTDVFKLINRYSLATTDEVPDGYDSWIQRLESLGADIEGKTVDGLNAINEAKDSALDRISTVSADGIEAVNEAKTQGVSAVNTAKTQGIEAVEKRTTDGVNAVNNAKNDGINRLNDRIESGKAEINTAKTTALSSIEQKKEAVHTELDGYVEAHHDELKGDKGDAYVVTEEDLKEIGDRVEAEYEPNLNALKEEVSHKAEADDLATANRKIKALTDVLNGKELAFEKRDYEASKVDVPSGAVADSVLKIGGYSRVSKNLINIDGATSGTNRGVTSVVNDDGSITVTGTFTETGYGGIVSIPKVILNGQYAFSINATIPNALINLTTESYSSIISMPINTASRTFTVSANVELARIVVRGDAGETVNFTIYPQLEKGGTVTDFEKHFDGIVSSQTDALEVRGANIFDIRGCATGTLSGISRTLNADGTMKVKGTSSIAQIIYLFGKYASTTPLFRLSKGTYTAKWISLETSARAMTYSGTFTLTEDTDICAVGLFANESRLQFDANTSYDYTAYPMLVKASTIGGYIPYSLTSIPTNLPTLRSAGSVHDSIEGGKLIRRVGEVDLGTLNWAYVAENVYFNGVLPNDANKAYTTWDNRFICSKYPYSRIVGADGVDKTCCLSTSLFRVKDTDYTDATAFKNAMQGVMLCYELAEPIITDIDPIPQLEAINVEAGGEVSFIDHSDMSFPIPTTHEFIVRNSEV